VYNMCRKQLNKQNVAVTLGLLKNSIQWMGKWHTFDEKNVLFFMLTNIILQTVHTLLAGQKTYLHNCTRTYTKRSNSS
jgi:uncharacterized protein YhbP (UPF0306 family)